MNPSWAHSSAINWLWMESGPKTFVNRMIVWSPLISFSGLEGGLTIYVCRPCRSWNWPRGVRVFPCESCCQLIHQLWGNSSEHTSYWAARFDGGLFRRTVHLVYSHLTIAFMTISIYGGRGGVDTEWAGYQPWESHFFRMKIAGRGRWYRINTYFKQVSTQRTEYRSQPDQQISTDIQWVDDKVCPPDYSPMWKWKLMIRW